MVDTLVRSQTRGDHTGVESTQAFMNEFESADVYNTLRRMATYRLGAMRWGMTLNPTMLVNEAFLRMVRGHALDGLKNANSSRVFYAAAAETMRRIVIDHYRKRNQQKRGRDFARVEMDVGALPDKTESPNLLALNEVITQFELIYPQKAELVKLRFFAKMTMPECAAALGISIATAERHWRFARAWLAEQLKD